MKSFTLQKEIAFFTEKKTFLFRGIVYIREQRTPARLEGLGMSAAGEELAILVEVHLGEANTLPELEHLALDLDCLSHLHSGRKAAINLDRHPRASRINGQERHGADDVNKSHGAATYLGRRGGGVNEEEQKEGTRRIWGARREEEEEEGRPWRVP